MFAFRKRLENFYISRPARASVGVLLKKGSDFVQKVPPIYNFSILGGDCLGALRLGRRASRTKVPFCEDLPRGAWQTVAKSALSASPVGEATAPQVRKNSENSEIVNWRWGWDSNPRAAFTASGFQDRRLRPLSHPTLEHTINFSKHITPFATMTMRL